MSARPEDELTTRHRPASDLRAPAQAYQPVLGIALVVLTFVVIAVRPELYAPWLILIISGIGVLAYWFGIRYAIGIIAAQAVELLLLGLWLRPTLWLVSYVAWFLSANLVAVGFDRMANRAETARRRYDDLVNGIDAVVWEAHTETGPADFVSERVRELFGFTPEECRDLGFLAGRVHPDDLDDVVSSRDRFVRGPVDPSGSGSDDESAATIESRFRMLDGWGRWRHVQHRVRTEVRPDGRVMRRGVVVDETGRWEAESSVRRYADFIEGIPIALVILRLDDLTEPRSLRIVGANPAAAELLRSAVDTTVGSLLVEVLPSSEDFLARLADVVRMNRPMEHPFLELFDVDEVFALRAVPLQDQSLGVSLEDVTKRTRLAESFRHQAEHDPLTGLANRTLLHDRLTRRLGVIGGTPTTALLMIDLNQFKEVNDALGHEAGDRLLIEVARRLAGNLPEHELLARLGGDEFAILLPPRAGSDCALEMARRATALCDEPFQIDDYRVQVSASVGITLAPDHATTAEMLLRRADSAMYRAKRQGGGIASYTPGHDEGNVRRLQLLADLRDAVGTDDFVIHYQPRFSLPSLRPVGVEALVRWDHPDLGLLPPSEFIELAEVSGAISLVTRLVTRRAVAEMGPYAAEHGLRISVNLSIRNLYEPTLVAWVAELISEADLPSGILCFELIESQLMDDPSQALGVLEDLRQLGVRLSVDDFGTGYSSLAYLRELPIDEVKIDRSFVADLDRGDARIVRSVIELGHNLGLHVVGEGVETAVSLDRLRDLDCDSAQGFHLAPPLPAPEVIALLDGARIRSADAARSAWEGVATPR